MRTGSDRYLVTTTILERGITIARLNVMVLQADAPVFSETVLVQIAGRVGRDKDYPTGDVILAYQEMTSALRAAKK
ncbi:helicase-related protein [Ligilactobacillus animalis]|uniref:helicase-related protein n=1 Tax=Ligilactobacillus animalis TaxID=1605 RepID=UPI002649E581|nr:helicase-related protein [Ligilactobacillus animalis]WKB74939.1 helicase-related protein [Ligilactobacillus animalis]